MNNYQLLRAVLIVLVLSFSACKKGDSGAAGPQGAQGAKGDQGNTGPIGPAGKDGSSMYSGASAPTSSVGAAGDYYLNRTTGELFGPKGAAGWGLAISLKGSTGNTGATGAAGNTGATGEKGATGATGAKGQDGSKTLSGTGVPAVSLGNAGDFYLDKTNYHLYGPKAATWGPALELKGKDGNANVRSYVFTNPWGSASVVGAAVLQFFATSGAFNYSTAELSDNLIQVYIYHGKIWYPATGKSLFSNVDASYYIYPESRVIALWLGRIDGTPFPDLAAVQSLVGSDFKVKIFVITTTNMVSRLKPGSPELTATLKPYLEK